MSIPYPKLDLPINAVVEEIKTELHEANTLIVNAPAGAGKSTLLPLALINESWLEGKKILMLEPRRLAARSIATRMADLIDQPIGDSIGYRVRFDHKISTNTKIEVLTEGILTRIIQTDNSLEDTGLVIFDEFHERSIHADVALALCREAQQILRPDLRILIMSATLDMPKLTQLLDCKAIQSKGRQYPIDHHYTGEADQMMIPELAARTIVKAMNDNDGDLLAFFPGQGEIRKCEEILSKNLKGFSLHALYGQLTHGEQMAAIFPNKEGKRKIVLATSIAETSLTIEGINIVVDTGFGRTSKFDPKSGLSRLQTVQISKDAADQRAGRAGRLGPGVCYRMWSLAQHHRLEAHRSPEITEVDLSSLALDLAQWGIKDPDQLTWLTPPPKGTIAQAKETLVQLEALKDDIITTHGKMMHKLPCHPRIAHMLILANDSANVHLAADVASFIEERDPLGKEAGIDINERIETLRRLRKDNRLGGKFSRFEKIASSYRRLFKVNTVDDSPVDPFETGLLLSHAYPERIAFARPGNNAQFKLSNGKIAMTNHRDDLAHEPWLAISHMDAREGIGKIFMASPLNPKDLAPMIKEKEVIKWKTDDGGLSAKMELRIGSIVLQSKPLKNPDPSILIDATLEAIRSEGLQLLNWDPTTQQLLHRVQSLKSWNPAQDWPEFKVESLMLSAKEWLAPYLTGVKTPEALKKIDLKDILFHSLSFDQQKILKQLAPEKMKVPSGALIAITYFEDAASPVLSVRLQEMFGLTDTPVINNGQTTLLLHLLSPGFKPMQVTSDLNSFWNNAYFEVKKELKRRYPKHSWPDDPLTATAVSGVDRNRGKK